MREGGGGVRDRWWTCWGEGGEGWGMGEEGRGLYIKFHNVQIDLFKV